MSEVGVTLKFITEYSGDEISITRDDYGNVEMKFTGSYLDLDDGDLDTLIKALAYFRDKKDKTVLEVPDDKFVAFPG